MIGLDTNVVVRYLTQDDPTQSKKASLLIENTLNEQNPGYISLIVLIEICWVLESCYDQKKSNLVEVIEGLLTTKQFLVERASIAHKALKKYRSGKGDFSDAIIEEICKDAGCEKTLTFDKKAISIGMEKL